MKPRPKIVALVGGSGAGKTWLSSRLEEALDLPVARLSLDDFYHDQSHLPPSQRESVNFDHPHAIDWPLVEAALQACREGLVARVPRYSFVSHTRRKSPRKIAPRPVILVDGLWLLWRPALRNLFDLSVFLNCTERVRLSRRLLRDVADRGREERSVRRMFREKVAPMHKQFVAPQAQWADVVLNQIVDEAEVSNLAVKIRGMVLPPHEQW